MKHITVELETKIRSQIDFVDDRLKQYIQYRRQVEIDTGELPPVEANEAEAAAWIRALRWVLEEGGCEQWVPIERR